MTSNVNNHNALRLAAFALALVMAVPAMAAPLPDAPSEPPAVRGDEPAEEPLQTQLRFVGDPEGEWAIELTGGTDWDASATSLQVWSPDGRAALADGEDPLRGRNLTTGKVWESFNFDALTDPVAQVRLSMEVDGGDAYGLNNDYHLYFYRIYDDESPDPTSGVNLATLVSDALADAGEDPTALPGRADAFYAWGAYGVAIDDMKGRCCNFSAMPDAPFSNSLPTDFVSTSGKVAPDLPPAMVEAVELVGAVEAFLPEDVRPSRVLENAGNVSVTAPARHTVDGYANVQAEIHETDPTGGGQDDSSGNSGRSVYIYGRVMLREPDTGFSRPCAYCSIDYYDSDGSSSHDYFGSDSTSAGGYFGEVVHVADGESAIDPYVRVGLHAPGRVSSVDEANQVYYYNPGQAQVVNCSDSSCDLDTITVHRSSPTGNYGYQQLDRVDWEGAAMAYYWAMVAHDRIDGNGYDVQNAVALRSPVAGTTAEYDGTRREVLLGSAYAKNPNTVAHEYGHALMHDIYENWSTGLCGTHEHHRASTDRCAWNEGWANFWSIHGLYSVTRYIAPSGEGPPSPVPKTRYYFVDNSWWDLESVTGLDSNGNSWTFDEGSDVESRVAATLWDLVDGTGEYLDNVDLITSTHVVPVMRANTGVGNTPTSIRTFYDDWRAHYSTDSSIREDFRDMADLNTIDVSGWPS